MFTRSKLPLVIGLFLIPILVFTVARGSDHADTREVVLTPTLDISDVHMFPSAENPNNVVLSMCSRPLIPAGQGANFSFDPNLLYQFKIDNTGDAVEDLVIQATFGAAGPSQSVTIGGPAPPAATGTVNSLIAPNPTTGTINTAFSPIPNVRVFAGAREDPFFIDLEEVCRVLPDRCSAITGQPVANPNQPQPPLVFRNPGVDFVGNTNVLAIVIELPRAQLGNGLIGLWCTISR